MEDKAQLRTYMAERQIIDIVRDHPGKLSEQQLVDALRPLTSLVLDSIKAEVEEEV